MLVASSLEDIVEEGNCRDTAQILYRMDRRIASVLNADKPSQERPEGRTLKIHDGGDLAAVFIANDGSVTLSSAGICVLLCDGKEVRRIKGQKLSIGDGLLTGKENVGSIVFPYHPNYNSTSLQTGCRPR